MCPEPIRRLAWHSGRELDGLTGVSPAAIYRSLASRVGPRRPRTLLARTRGSSSFLRVFAVALTAASLAYLLHHVSFLQAHALQAASLAIVGAALLALAPVAAAARRRHAPLHVVLVASPEQASIRSAGRAEIPFSAALHAQALEHGFFVDLGPRFLRAYHRTFIDSPHGLALVAELAGHPVGMLLGLLRPRQHMRWILRRRGVPLLLLGAAALAGRPQVAIRFLRTRPLHYLRVWRRSHSEAHVPANTTGGYASEPALLSHVAVLPGARGAGAGGQLVAAFERSAAQAGVLRAELVTLGDDDGAGSFYLRRGWGLAGHRITLDGRTMERYTRELGTPERS